MNKRKALQRLKKQGENLLKEKDTLNNLYPWSSVTKALIKVIFQDSGIEKANIIGQISYYPVTAYSTIEEYKAKKELSINEALA